MYRTDSAAGELTSAGALHSSKSPPARSVVLGRLLKRVMDVAGSAFFILLFLPFFVIVALGVRMSSRGPIFYSQRRVGRHGRTIHVYKFRSMRVDADEVLATFLDSDAGARAEWESHHKLKTDPRITSFGRFIRRTSLDEIPQFWNVLRGDMSLIGPRPVTTAERHRYREHWPMYCAMRPGISGLWQVSGRSRLTYDERVALDVKYVRGWSVWMDIKILVRTVKVVLATDGSH